MAHEVAATDGGQVVVGVLLSLLATEVEHHHVGLLESCYVEAVFVEVADERIVAIDKLDITTRGILQSAVAGGAESAVALPDIYNGVGKVGERCNSGTLRAVVDNDDLTLKLTQRQTHDAVDALAEQGLGQVVGGDDKAD